MEDVVCSLVFLSRGDRVYLAFGKKGFNEGRYNTCGGKQEVGETIAECAVREAREEWGVMIAETDLRKVCVIILHWDGEIGGISRPNARTLYLHVYVVDRWEGEPRRSEAFEKPVCFKRDELPLEQMPPDNRYWLDRALFSKSRPFTAEVWMRKKQTGVTPTNFVFHSRSDQSLLDVP